MNLSDFDYNYPDDLIAIHPLPDRDASRMMVLNRGGKEVCHSHIRDLPNFLKKGDILVINNTRVFPARLVGKKESGGYFEILLLSQVVIPAKAGESPPLKRGDKGGFAMKWRCITDQTKTSKPGLKILFGTELIGTIISREGEELIIEFNKPELIEGVGLPPVPPYIRARRCHCDPPKAEKRSTADNCEEEIASPLSGASSKLPADRRNDKNRYQTIYAKYTGSAAAPTAGLHFTEKLMARIKETGVSFANVTLHIGLDTFSPVREENILKHKIHGEGYFVPDETIAAIDRVKASGGRVIAVGTTSVRALESVFPLPLDGGNSAHPPLKKGGRGGITNLFIYPGYKFRTVDAVLTNFHQPKSTLLMLVSAFAGREFILRAYEDAIQDRYRLFSYGDCMLIL